MKEDVSSSDECKTVRRSKKTNDIKDVQVLCWLKIFLEPQNLFLTNS